MGTGWGQASGRGYDSHDPEAQRGKGARSTSHSLGVDFNPVCLTPGRTPASAQACLWGDKKGNETQAGL